MSLISQIHEYLDTDTILPLKRSATKQKSGTSSQEKADYLIGRYNYMILFKIYFQKFIIFYATLILDDEYYKMLSFFP